MLTRFSSAVSATLLAAGAIAATVPGAAAAPCNSGGGAVGCSLSGHVHYGGGGGGTGGGGGDGGGSGPGLGCPIVGNTIACDLGQDPARVRHVPTIDVAYNARDQLAVPAPHPHTAPRARTFVQIRTGLWVDAADFTTKSVTVSAADQSVTATATPTTVTWAMGEGQTVCAGPGVAGGTACGYTYRRSSAAQPDGRYHISATITWTVAWTCTGACDQAGGTLDPLTMTTPSRLTVGEVQTGSRPG